ncbi:unnamed protein product, partial [Ascophyllum nodosum]
IFPYGVEDDASTKNQTPTTHYTSTCVKLTIVTYLSFSERIAIANLSLINSVKQEEDTERERVRGRGIYLPLGDAPISNSAARFRHFTCLDLRPPCTCTPDLSGDLRTLSTCT